MRHPGEGGHRRTENLWMRRSLRKVGRQRRGASPLEDDNVDESGESEGDDEDLEVLRRALDES